MAKLKIAIACSSLTLGKGGSERAAVNLAEAMTLRGHSVLLLSCIGPDGNTTPAYPIAKGVRHISVTRTGWYEEISSIRKFLEDEDIDVFLAFGSSSIFLFWASICMGSGIPFICSERSDPVTGIENLFWNRAGRLAVLFGSDCIHELLSCYQYSVPDIISKKVAVIPNSAPAYSFSQDAKRDHKKSILYLARFCELKRPFLLLKAFSCIMDKYPDWNLVIWGHGELEDAMRNYIHAAGMQNRINLMGICDNPALAYASAQIYCLPSSHEGFPNTVLEAMSAGLPVVGFKSCVAMASIVDECKFGLLAQEDTPESLASALERLMKDDELRLRLGLAAKEAASKYSHENIFDKWELLFNNLAKCKGNTVMDKLAEESFLFRARLSLSARKEWIFRDFGAPFPGSFAWLKSKFQNLLRNFQK